MGRVWKKCEIQYIEHVLVWEWIGAEENVNNCQSREILTDVLNLQNL
jgi:hypothetical protein